ncbi:immunoglobulin domain-containing protein [Opitutaceae bacterium]|nr:immunoglobulin domain-containing protein [Opitutaceae bacterium]
MIDQTETETFDLELDRDGNVYSTVLPVEPEPNSVVREEVRIVLDGDFAILTALRWSTSTEAGLVGQTFSYSTVGYVLSRDAFPAQPLSGFEGEYAYRLQGQAAVFGETDRRELVDVPSITIRDVGGFGQTNYQGSERSFDAILATDALGLVGESSTSLLGVAQNVNGLSAAGDELKRYSMAVQLNATDVAWMHTATLIGTVNAGTSNAYSVLLNAGTLGGVATRTVASRPEFTRNLPAEVAVLEGGDLFLSAEVTGAPAPQYQWYMSTETGSDFPFLEPILFGDTRFDIDNINETSLASTPNLVLRNVTSAMDGWMFQVEAMNASGGTQSTPVRLKVLSAPTARLPNLSVRTTLGAAQNLAVGFVMTGGSKPLLIRAVGPTLGDFGVGDAMPNPRIGFNDPEGTELDANDDWDASLAPTFGELGAFALTEGSKDAALRVDLSGLGTVSVNGPEAGTVLVEVYDIGDSNDTRMVNVSARNQVGTGSNILIAGFVVRGDDPKNMLIRAVGPGLKNFGLTGTLDDPLLKIFKQNSSDPSNPILVGTNDNWSPGLRPSFQKTGAFDLTTLSLDAAMVITLEPGAYTAQVSGADGGTGQAIVEIYELP